MKRWICSALIAALVATTAPAHASRGTGGGGAAGVDALLLLSVVDIFTGIATYANFKAVADERRAGTGWVVTGSVGGGMNLVVGGLLTTMLVTSDSDSDRTLDWAVTSTILAIGAVSIGAAVAGASSGKDAASPSQGAQAAPLMGMTVLTFLRRIGAEKVAPTLRARCLCPLPEKHELELVERRRDHDSVGRASISGHADRNILAC